MDKIHYVENGEIFTDRGSIYNTTFKEVSDAEYKRLLGLPYGEVDTMLKNNMSEVFLCAYGYYGHEFCIKEGKHFIGTKVGKSCD